MTADNKVSQKRISRVLWVEKLCLSDIVGAVFARPFSGQAIYYGEYGESYLVRQALSLIKLFKVRLDISAISLSLEKESSNGRTLAYNVQEDLFFCCKKFIEKYVNGRPSRQENAIKCYLSDVLRKRVAFAAVVESKARLMRDKRHIIRFRKHSMNEMLYRLYEKRGFIVKEPFSVSEYIRYMARISKMAMSVIMARILSGKPRSNITNIMPAIWIEYTHMDVVDFAFWKKNINKALFDIVYYLDRDDTPIAARITDEIEKGGDRWVDAHLGAIASHLNVSTITAAIKYLCRLDGRPPWVRIFDFEYNFWESAYKECFKKFKVKIVIQHRDTSWIQEAQAMAIESSGGIMMGFHWSNYPCQMTPEHLFPYHVFFIWGKIIKDFLPEKETGTGYLLPSGLWMPKDKVDLNKIVKRLKDIKFTFTIFDSSVAHNIHQTPHSLSQFYLLLLSLLEKNVSWGAVIKSKSGDIDSLLTLPDGKEIVLRFQSLMEQDRVFFLKCQLSPVIAAAFTNLSVCYGLNSAGIVAGAYGHKAVHWDCSGWIAHPFYKDSLQKIVFKTPEELENAIVAASKGDMSIGDFSGWKREFNYFDDFNADRRVGEFIQDVMDTSLKTGDARDILDFAAKRYIERNRVESDFSGSGSSFESYKNSCGVYVL